MWDLICCYRWCMSTFAGLDSGSDWVYSPWRWRELEVCAASHLRWCSQVSGCGVASLWPSGLVSDPSPLSWLLHLAATCNQAPVSQSTLAPAGHAGFSTLTWLTDVVFKVSHKVDFGDIFGPGTTVMLVIQHSWCAFLFVMKDLAMEKH